MRTFQGDIEMNILLVLGLVGVTLILTRGSIFEGMRWKFPYQETVSFFPPLNQFMAAIFHCPQCAGFWVGFIGSLFVSDYDLITVIEKPFSILFAGIFGGLVSFLSMGFDLLFATLARFLPPPLPNDPAIGGVPKNAGMQPPPDNAGQ